MNKFTAALLSVSLVALFAVYAIAETKEKSEKKGKPSSKKAEKFGVPALCGCCGPNRPVSPLIAALDVDKDGIISELEIKNAASSLQMLDNDGDGRLARQEYHVEVKSVASKNGRRILMSQTGYTQDLFMTTMFHKYDISRNGFIDAEEMPVALTRILNLVDLNGDGRVGKRELDAFSRSIGK